MSCAKNAPPRSMERTPFVAESSIHQMRLSDVLLFSSRDLANQTLYPTESFSLAPVVSLLLAG